MRNKDKRLPQKPVGQLAWSTQCNLKQQRLCLKQSGRGGYLWALCVPQCSHMLTHKHMYKHTYTDKNVFQFKRHQKVILELKTTSEILKFTEDYKILQISFEPCKPWALSEPHDSKQKHLTTGHQNQIDPWRGSREDSTLGVMAGCSLLPQREGSKAEAASSKTQEEKLSMTASATAFRNDMKERHCQVKNSQKHFVFYTQTQPMLEETAGCMKQHRLETCLQKELSPRSDTAALLYGLYDLKGHMLVWREISTHLCRQWSLPTQAQRGFSLHHGLSTSPTHSEQPCQGLLCLQCGLAYSTWNTSTQFL